MIRFHMSCQIFSALDNDRLLLYSHSYFWPALGSCNMTLTEHRMLTRRSTNPPCDCSSYLPCPAAHTVIVSVNAHVFFSQAKILFSAATGKRSISLDIVGGPIGFFFWLK